MFFLLIDNRCCTFQIRDIPEKSPTAMLSDTFWQNAPKLGTFRFYLVPLMYVIKGKITHLWTKGTDHLDCTLGHHSVCWKYQLSISCGTPNYNQDDLILLMLVYSKQTVNESAFISSLKWECNNCIHTSVVNNSTYGVHDGSI
jgi:hypothetical protein